MLKRLLQSLKNILKPIKSQVMTDLDAYNKIKEGKAEILFPKEDKVFYNPIQQFNRDLSICGIRAWSELYQSAGKKRNNEGEVKPFINILEALSASGLRALRYGHEIPLVKKVVANDFSPAAVESIKLNIEHNQLNGIVKANEGDAILFMSQFRDKPEFHVIDLDPYGTATPFIDSAVQAVKNDGLLLVTCTDLGVLAGSSYPEKCFALYGGTNIPGDATHESALRLVLSMIASTAAKYKKTIEPMLSLSIDFYVRLFIRVKTSPIKVKEHASTTMINYHCSGCGTTYDQPLGKKTQDEKTGRYKFTMARGPPVGEKCTFCHKTMHLAGPMWAGQLHNKTFIDKSLQISKSLDKDVYGTTDRIEGMLTLAKQELETPFYFKPGSLSSVIKCPAPPINELVSALGNLGYMASLTHAMPSAIKTNAPWEAIWYIMKTWLNHRKEESGKNLSETSPGYAIIHNDQIGKDIELKEYEELYKKNDLYHEIKSLRNFKIVRFQQNPTKFWGPKAKPTN
ncbi:tRNA methyltransferase [Komagataella phaffii]|uniref:tRNA (guanine(26)-N(2))-dimethyltransferase n=2 Tax=Komagataella phaffii TaxID=460519 RepID=C4QZL7_KOMPG|nr:tRNA methyltransferase, localizes to both the nucleus and mitochondrion to produce the modified base [Komagataella phaffii GS115]AOA62703.1 GQ67_00113T0 [Komagataella phaffii]AOA68177.1 GQ68_01275T0 [Komagataella phaffii GS115]CAY68691.1 tRNA methyltransferase, localizes to both the nucleus and mitochondrion to produce the modified base [Komagataella phaffii GS115]